MPLDRRFVTPMTDRPRPFRSILLIVLLVALLARLPVMLTILHHPERAILGSDARQYLGLAAILARYGTFSESPPPILEPHALRTPGYPAFIALFVPVWGASPLGPLAVAQGVIGAAVAVGVAMLGYRLFDRRVGLIAGLGYALAPVSVVMTGYAYAETLFAAWLVGGALLLVIGSDRQRWPLSGLGGLAFGAAALTRPIGLPLVPLLLAIPFTRLPPHRAWRHALALLAGFTLLAGAWMARNYNHFGHFSLSIVGDLNLYYYNAASLEAHRLGIPLGEARAQLDERLAEWPVEGDPWPAASQGALARATILAHPLAFAWYNGLDALNGCRPGFSFLLGLFDPSADRRDVVAVFMGGNVSAALDALQAQAALILALEGWMVLFTAVLVVLCLVGLVLLLIRKRWLESILLALIPALLLYLPGIASNARFRAPVEPFLAILAAVGLDAVLAFFRRRRANTL
jgi:4-amino-4-deoxy-L-arabinose transferase-like glycosyltransferase